MLNGGIPQNAKGAQKLVYNTFCKKEIGFNMLSRETVPPDNHFHYLKYVLCNCGFCKESCQHSSKTCVEVSLTVLEYKNK